MQIPGFSVSANLFSHSLGAKGAHCIDEVTALHSCSILLWRCLQTLSERRPRQKIRTAGDPQFSLSMSSMISASIYMLCLSGFFLHCLLEKEHVIGWFGRWHHGLEGCGTVWHSVWGVRTCGWVLSCFLYMFVFCYLIMEWCLWETSSEWER